MSQRWLVGCALVFGGLAAVIAGCWNRGPDRVNPPKIDAVAAGQEAIKMYDTNHDGKISGAELDKCPDIKAALLQIDPSGKGEVTAEMITARIKKVAGLQTRQDVAGLQGHPQRHAARRGDGHLRTR